MADNTQLNTGAGGDLIATDELAMINGTPAPSGVKVQRVKVGYGADGDLTDVTDDWPMPVTQKQKTVCCSFSGSGAGLVTPFMTSLINSMTVSQANGNLIVATGVNARAEFLARSVTSFKSSMILKEATILSQRIANQNFLVMLADKIGDDLAVTVNSATSITVTLPAHGFTEVNVGQSMFIGGINGVAGVQGRYAIASIPSADTINFTVAGWPASGTGTVDLFGWNFVKLHYSGTVASNMLFDASRQGWASGDTTATINTTAAPGHIATKILDGRTVRLSDSSVSITSANTTTTRSGRQVNMPDEDVELYVYVWSYNGATAPASTTTWTLGFWSVEEYDNTPVYIAGIRNDGGFDGLGVRNTSGNNMTVSIAPLAWLGANSTHKLTSAATTNATLVKSSAANINSLIADNTSASLRYLKIANSATIAVPGTTTPVYTFPLLPNSMRNIDCGAFGIRLATGFTYWITGAPGDLDTTAIGAGEVFVNCSFT